MTFDDAIRLRALDDYRVLDTPPEEALDGLAGLAAKFLRAPIALVSFVAEERQWFKARYGLEYTETPREWAFCDHAIRAGETLVVPDATADARFVDNPLVAGPDHIRFYCGTPLRTPDGHGLGTLCVLDTEPRAPTADEVVVLEMLARQVEIELEIRRRLLMLEDSLGAARDRQRSKELLASMIVHDMRGPLTSIMMLAMGIAPADAPSKVDLELLLVEAERMGRMLTDILDVCLHEVGGLRARRIVFPIASLARNVASRVVRAFEHPPAIRVEGSDALMVDADPELVTRTLENLLANGLNHARDAGEIVVSSAAASDGRVKVEVRDQNDVIADTDRESIFDAFKRGPSQSKHRGYGLGLSFCRIAVETHGGKLSVAANGDGVGNCFSFDLPAA